MQVHKVLLFLEKESVDFIFFFTKYRENKMDFRGIKKKPVRKKKSQKKKIKFFYFTKKFLVNFVASRVLPTTAQLLCDHSWCYTTFTFFLKLESCVVRPIPSVNSVVMT